MPFAGRYTGTDFDCVHPPLPVCANIESASGESRQATCSISSILPDTQTTAAKLLVFVGFTSKARQQNNNRKRKIETEMERVRNESRRELAHSIGREEQSYMGFLLTQQVN